MTYKECKGMVMEFCSLINGWGCSADAYKKKSFLIKLTNKGNEIIDYMHEGQTAISKLKEIGDVINGINLETTDDSDMEKYGYVFNRIKELVNN